MKVMRVLAVLFAMALLGAKLAHAQELDKDGLYRQPFLVLDPGTHTAPIRALATDSAGRYIVTSSFDKSLRVWASDTGSLLRVIRMPSGPGDIGSLYAVAVAPDGLTIATGGWMTPTTFGIYLFERSTGRQMARIPLDRSTGALAFSPDGKRIAVTVGGQSVSKWSTYLYEVPSGRRIAADDNYGAPAYGLAVDHSGRIVTVSRDGKIRLYDSDLKLLQVTTVPAGEAKDPATVAFSPRGDRIAIGYGFSDNVMAHVDVVEGNTLKKLFHVQTEDQVGRLSQVQWSRDGTILYAGGGARIGENRVVLAWDDGGRGTKRSLGSTTTDSVSGILTFYDGRVAVASMQPRLAMLDRTGSIAWQVDPKSADFRGALERFKLGANGKKVEFDAQYSGGSPSLFDVSKRVIAEPSFDSTLAIPTTDTLPITSWKDSHHPKFGSRPLAIDPGERSRSLAIARDRQSFWLGSEWSLRHFDASGALIRRVDVPAIPWILNLTEDGRVVVGAFGDGTIRWYRTEDGAEILAFFPYPDRGHWIAWTPLGHYAASPGAEDWMQWQINRGRDAEPITFSASRFRDQFYRPDVVERALDTLDPKKALELADQDAGRQTNLKSIVQDTPPRVSIIDPANSTYVSHPDVVVAYTIEDKPLTLVKRIRLLVDGRVVKEQLNQQIPLEGRFVGEFKVSLQGERPLLTVLAESNRGVSDPATVFVRRNAADDADKGNKPNLYVLAIGVSEFKNADHLKLKFAHSDATRFVERLRKQERGIYNRVQVLPLVNEQATGREIMKGLEWLERNVSADDVTAILISTHGTNDANRELHFLPHDVEVKDDISLRLTSVSYYSLRQTLKRLGERGKTLVFLDACHAGNILPGAKAAALDIDKVVAELLGAENGVIVFASSTGTQFSMEAPEHGNGAFTAAILEILDGKANLSSPYLRVSDINIWLSKRVRELTNGAQTPLTRVPGEKFWNPQIFMVRPPG